MKSTKIKCAGKHNVEQFFYGSLTLYKFDVQEKVYKADTEKSFFLCTDQCKKTCNAKHELGLCEFTDNDFNALDRA